MGEKVGDDGYEATKVSASRNAVDGGVVRPVGVRATAQFEHEVAALDLSDAEQLAVWSEAMAEQGDVTESQRLAAKAARLCESADQHRRTAERLERQADLDV